MVLEKEEDRMVEEEEKEEVVEGRGRKRGIGGE